MHMLKYFKINYNHGGISMGPMLRPAFADLPPLRTPWVPHKGQGNIPPFLTLSY